MENRRDFLKTLVGLTAGLTLPFHLGATSENYDQFGERLPMRKLGLTGENVTMLGLGGYHVGWTSEKDAQEVIETAIEGGIRFFDTAHNYKDGISEERYGKYLIPKYRDSIFLMTKSQANNGKELMEEFELSLRRLKTDRVDLLQIHSLKNPEDVKNRKKNGVIDAMKKIKKSGKAKFIGFTGHSNPEAHIQMMQNNPDIREFSTIQMPVNAVDLNSSHSFIKKALPLALENKLGLLAMKTLADGRFFSIKQQVDKIKWKSDRPAIPNYISVKEALYFVWSLPLSVLISGAENKDLLKEKINLARNYVRLSNKEKNLIIEKSLNIPDRDNIEYYKQNIT
jgi:predicted aldo/keto reductase-like oxidoreductase